MTNLKNNRRLLDNSLTVFAIRAIAFDLKIHRKATVFIVKRNWGAKEWRT